MNTNDTPVAEIEAAPAAAATKPAKPIIAIVARTQGMGEAMKTILSRSKQHQNADLRIVQKMSDAPEGSTFASAGLPSFVMGTEPVKVLSIQTNSSLRDDARKEAWELIQDETATQEDLLPVLGNPESYLVLNGRAIAAIKAEIADLKVAAAEAETTEDKLAAYKALAEFALRSIGLGK